MKQLIYKTRRGYDSRNRCSFNRFPKVNRGLDKTEGLDKRVLRLQDFLLATTVKYLDSCLRSDSFAQAFSALRSTWCRSILTVWSPSACVHRHHHRHTLRQTTVLYWCVYTV